MLDSWARFIELQDYPKNKIEVLVANDSTDDTAEKLLTLKDKLPNLRVFNFEGKNSNGIKRQWLIDRSDGDILIHFDDDDYYFPTRISDAVFGLQRSPRLIAGHSTLYIWHMHSQKMTQSGPWGPNHACCGSFAYKKEYIRSHKFSDVNQGPEPGFTNKFTEPMVQLNHLKSMICIDHGKNTVKKRMGKPAPHIKAIVNDPEVLKFFYGNKHKRLRK